MEIDIDVETTPIIPRPIQSVIDWKAVDMSARTRYEQVMEVILLFHMYYMEIMYVTTLHT